MQRKNYEYSINLTTLIKDAGMDCDLPLAKKFQKVKRAIEGLIKKKVIKCVEYQYTKEGRKTIEILIKFFPTDEFASRTMKSNFVSKELKTKP